VAAFDGWNDAGEAASRAVGHLGLAWGAVPVAEIDPEEFFDFTDLRPEVSIVEGEQREVSWPATTVSFAGGDPEGPDVVLLEGPEPHLRWGHYCDAVVALARRARAARVVMLGAYLSEVSHARPVPLSGVSSDGGLLARHGLGPTLYEGPTGIVGVLGPALARAGIAATSIWASVPYYSTPVSAKAALALVRIAAQIVGRPVETSGLEEEAAEYERRMDELVRDDENVAAYVARLEEMEDIVGAGLSAEGLAEEIQRYLRGRQLG
jgi:proteasome assembly chaperone (PAC2) family protein